MGMAETGQTDDVNDEPDYGDFFKGHVTVFIRKLSLPNNYFFLENCRTPKQKVSGVCAPPAAPLIDKRPP